MSSVRAHIVKVEQDPSSGWGKIFTDDPNVKVLQTRIAEKLKEAGALKKSGELALIEFSEKQGNVNPHTGQPYLNRYYERAGSISMPEDEGIDVVQQAAPTRKTDPDDAWRMCLNKGGELAVATLPLMQEGQRSFDDQKAVAVAWARFFFFTPQPRPEEMAFGGGNGFGAGNSDDWASRGEATPPHGDDDIPF